MREEYEEHLRNVILELDEKPSDGMSKRSDVEDPGNTKKDEKHNKTFCIKLHTN